MQEPPILHRKITQEWELDSSIIDIIRFWSDIMNNGLQTEEFRKKKNYKPFIMIAILMLVIGFIIYGIYIYMAR